jgi:phosphinothricin acetyltransferase
MLTIHPASHQDIAAITAIYNDAILNTTSTFDAEIKSIDDRTLWLQQHDAKHPVIVAVEDDIVVGWGSLSKWSDKIAYDTTAEVSFYVHQHHRGKGIGKLLLEVLTTEGKAAGLHCLISRITEGNEVSIYLHHLFGFEYVGLLKEVGKKFDQYLDVHIYQKIFND